MWKRFPVRMRAVVTGSLERAGRDGAAQAQPSHLFAAALSEPDSVAGFVLQQCGVNPADVLARLERAHPAAAQAPQQVCPMRRERAAALSAGALHVLDVAVGEANRLSDQFIGTEHLLLAALAENASSVERANPCAAAANPRQSDLDSPPPQDTGQPKTRPISRAEVAAMLRQFGVTRQAVHEGIRAWRRDPARRLADEPRQMPGRGSGWRWLPQPVRRGLEMTTLGWRVLWGRSLAHPKFVTDPYPLYRWLRKRAPVRRDPAAPVWVVTSYAETLTMLKDPRFKKDPFAAERLPPRVREQLGVSQADAGRASGEMVSMLFLDPPDHTRVRTLFSRAFTPRRLEAFRPRIQQITDKLLDRAEARARSATGRDDGNGRGESRGDGTIDLVRDLAYPLPVTVIAELLGFPPEDFEQIKIWSDEMAQALALNPSPEAQSRAYSARQEIRTYFEALVNAMRDKPGDNLVSELITGEAYGERGDRLNSDELFANSILLLAAGHETTTGLISNGMLALLRHPAQLADLRDNLDQQIAPAVEELLRFDPPVQWTSRTAGETLELGGVQIKRGQLVLASFGAANRDPAVFANPDMLDLRRQPGRHMAFGSGIHFCLGAALARWEAQTAISTLLRRYPNLALAKQPLRWRKGVTFRGLMSLRLKI